MRLFVGSFLENELIEKIPFKEIQKIFGDNLKSIPARGGSAFGGKKGNIHMTWIFIGNVVETIHELSLQEIIDKHINEFKGLIFQAHGLELWPPKRSPGLIVLSGKLNKQINLNPIIHDLKEVCSPDEKADFIPHITIARFKKNKTIDKKIKLPEIESCIWEIKELSLIQSILTSEGPKYEKVKNWVC